MRPGSALAIFLVGSTSDVAGAFPTGDRTATGQSTVLLGDLASGEATTEVGRAIQAILEGTASALVDDGETYTPPSGGLHGQLCHQDTCCVWSHIAADMEAKFRLSSGGGGGGGCTSLARGAIRMGFHDAGAWNMSIPPLPAATVALGIGGGGADGSILLSDGELDRMENRGLQYIAELLRSWYELYHASHGVSAADLIQMGALVATAACPGGPRIRAFVGRHDVVPGSLPPPPGLLPQPSSDAPRLLDAFAAKTLSATDLVALVGAHTVSRQHFVDATRAGQAQDSTPEIFDTRFFVETAAVAADQSSPPGVYSFHSDVSLATDPKTRPIWASYASEKAHSA